MSLKVFPTPREQTNDSLVNCCTCFGAEPPGFVRYVVFFGAKLRSPGLKGLPSRELTYPTWGKGKSSLNTPYQGDILISWRVIFSEFSMFFIGRYWDGCCGYLDQWIVESTHRSVGWIRLVHRVYTNLFSSTSYDRFHGLDTLVYIS